MGAPPGGIIDSRYLELGIDHALGEGDLFFSRRAATKKAQAQILKPKDVVHSHCGGDEVGNAYWDGNENGNETGMGVRQRMEGIASNTNLPETRNFPSSSIFNHSRYH